MNQLNLIEFSWSFGLDLVTIFLLSHLFYFRRHRDREMAVAIGVINVTLFALTGALAVFTLSLGVGFALFAVVSVIRLRSDTAGWIEMAYLLTGLSSGLILGLPGFSMLEKCIFAGIQVLIIGVIDSPILFKRSVLQKVSLTLDGTRVDAEELRSTVEQMLGRSVDTITVKSISSNPPQTKIDVRYKDASK